jgi:hypothetical protein
MVKKQPKTKLVANISFLRETTFFPKMKGKFKIDGYFPTQKANHLFKDDMERIGLLLFTPI